MTTKYLNDSMMTKKLGQSSVTKTIRGNVTNTKKAGISTTHSKIYFLNLLLIIRRRKAI